MAASLAVGRWIRKPLEFCGVGSTYRRFPNPRLPKNYLFASSNEKPQQILEVTRAVLQSQPSSAVSPGMSRVSVIVDVFNAIKSFQQCGKKILCSRGRGFGMYVVQPGLQAAKDEFPPVAVAFVRAPLIPEPHATLNPNARIAPNPKAVSPQTWALCPAPSYPGSGPLHLRSVRGLHVQFSAFLSLGCKDLQL